jgi:hypothetical protein
MKIYPVKSVGFKVKKKGRDCLRGVAEKQADPLPLTRG